MFTSKQRTKSGSHRLAIMTVNGVTKMVKVPAETNGTVHVPLNEVRRIWDLSPDAAIRFD